MSLVTIEAPFGVHVIEYSSIGIDKELKLIPHATVHIFAEVGHLPMVEIPEESAEVYQQFLSTVE